MENISEIEELLIFEVVSECVKGLLINGKYIM